MTEISLVKKELDLLSDDAQVFRLLGNILIKQSKNEVAANTKHRLDFVKGEIDLIESSIRKTEGARDDAQKKAYEIQQKSQQARPQN